MVIIDILTPRLSSQFSPGDVTNPPVGSLERREEEDGSGGAVEAGPPRPPWALWSSGPPLSAREGGSNARTVGPGRLGRTLLRARLTDRCSLAEPVFLRPGCRGLGKCCPASCPLDEVTALPCLQGPLPGHWPSVDLSETVFPLCSRRRVAGPPVSAFSVPCWLAPENAPAFF